jgi:hypothetical protein
MRLRAKNLMRLRLLPYNILVPVPVEEVTRMATDLLLDSYLLWVPGLIPVFHYLNFIYRYRTLSRQFIVSQKFLILFSDFNRFKLEETANVTTIVFI